MRARFSAPVQTGLGAHPASYKIGTGSFPGLKRPGSGVDHPSPSGADVKERVELYIYSHSGFSWPVIGRSLPLLYLKRHSILYTEVCHTAVLLKVFWFLYRRLKLLVGTGKNLIYTQMSKRRRYIA